MTDLTLHGAARSSAAYRVRIALQLKGLDVRHVLHDLRAGEQRLPQFLALNPAGLVPVLVTDAGDALTNSLAIIEYLEELQPSPALLPRDAIARARVRGLAMALACDVHPLQNLRVLQRLHSEFGADAEATQGWAQHWIATGFAALEHELAHSAHSGRCMHGDTPTLADICLVPQVANAHRFKLDLAPYPRLSAIATHCEALPAFQRAHPDNYSR